VTFGGNNFDVPFIVCGDGGHNANALVQGKNGQPGQEPAKGAKVSYLDPSPVVQASGLVLENYDDKDYGYLLITVNAKQLSITFHPVNPIGAAHSTVDTVTIDLASHTKV
jgi:hypothetical protein